MSVREMAVVAVDWSCGLGDSLGTCKLFNALCLPACRRLKLVGLAGKGGRRSSSVAGLDNAVREDSLDSGLESSSLDACNSFRMVLSLSTSPGGEGAELRLDAGLPPSSTATGPSLSWPISDRAATLRAGSLRKPPDVVGVFLRKSRMMEGGVVPRCRSPKG